MIKSRTAGLPSLVSRAHHKGLALVLGFSEGQSQVVLPLLGTSPGLGNDKLPIGPPAFLAASKCPSFQHLPPVTVAQSSLFEQLRPAWPFQVCIWEG